MRKKIRLEYGKKQYKQFCISDVKDSSTLEAYFKNGLFLKYQFDREWILEFSSLAFSRNQEYYYFMTYEIWEKVYEAYKDVFCFDVPNGDQSFWDEFLRSLKIGEFSHKYYEKYKRIQNDTSKNKEEIRDFEKEKTPYDNAKQITGVDNIRQWILHYFFYDSFTRTWESSNKSGMRTVYRTCILEKLEAFANKATYLDGKLMIFYHQENVVFYYNKTDEEAVLSHKEYYDYLEELSQLYMTKYFCLQSEKSNLLIYYKRC